MYANAQQRSMMGFRAPAAISRNGVTSCSGQIGRTSALSSIMQGSRRGNALLDHRRAPSARTASTSSRRQTRTSAVAGGEFEPQLDPQFAAQQLTVLGLTLSAGAYWWFVVVPSERKALGKLKRKGDLRTYLDDISTDDTKSVERWFYTDWLQADWFQKAQAKKQQQAAAAGAISPAAAPLASTAAAPIAASPGAVDPSADPAQAAAAAAAAAAEAERIEKEFELRDAAQPRFWSLDNPLVATAALIGGGVALGALFGRM